ncbi:hypothetical protein CERSUDRAFT_114698 [Gelatoporia subvermispora B]|uniref:Uncharacterized protein n=1 Tax=Ceriporiopsis subvermispora (strain B) TaxID=914234 RepID=M2PKG3_CERS8|nr:hypothetical protein CERSUDRAFT_114698 [Gelatoporia subvermispora B]
MPRCNRKHPWQMPLPRRNPGRDDNGLNWRHGQSPCNPTLARSEWEEPFLEEDNDHVAQAGVFDSDGTCTTPKEHVVLLMQIAKEAKPRVAQTFEIVRPTQQVIALDDAESMIIDEEEWEDLYPEARGKSGKAVQKKLYSEVLMENPG